MGIDYGGAAKLLMSAWWLNFFWTPKWSNEETSIRGRIWALAVVVFLLAYIPEMVILDAVGIDRHISAIIGLFTCCPLALIAGRRMSVRLWPDLVKKADENATKRIGR